VIQIINGLVKTLNQHQLCFFQLPITVKNYLAKKNKIHQIRLGFELKYFHIDFKAHC